MDEDGTLSGWAEYASGGTSISSAVFGSVSTIVGLPRPAVEDVEDVDAAAGRGVLAGLVTVVALLVGTRTVV